jgi:RNA polymerase sigma factor (sigma-70 family)
VPVTGIYLGVDVQELLARYEATFRRAARRVSLCDDDAEDALQRAALILLAKAPSTDPRRLVPWMVVVTRREALAVRRSRERDLLASPPTGHDASPSGSFESIASDRPGPAERYERTERVRDTAAALARLKPAEHRAIVLQAAGYSYAEICELCGWSYTKVNRSLAEGRERLRRTHSV